MADKFASRTYVNPMKKGRGRWNVSEGIAPVEKFLADIALPTLFVDPTHKEFFECVMVRGTILSFYPKTYADGTKGYVAGPSLGADGCQLDNVLYDAVTGVTTYDVPAAVASGDQVSLGVKFCPKGLRAGASAADKLEGQKSVPQGVLDIDAYRAFDSGENEGVTFITHGYVEWPLVRKVDKSKETTDAAYVLFDNTDLAVGDYVKSDKMGRPVKWRHGVDPEYLRIGHVIAREDLTGPSANFDFGFLQYMQLPFDTFEAAMLNTVYESTTIDSSDDSTDKVFGVRPNVNGELFLNDPAQAVAGTVGCVRVNLFNM